MSSPEPAAVGVSVIVLRRSRDARSGFGDRTAQRTSLIRIRLPEGSRNAQSRTP